MPISIQCPSCKRGMKAPDAAAGRTLKCPACTSPITIPAPEIDPADILLGNDEPTDSADHKTRHFAEEPEQNDEEDSLPPEPIRKKPTPQFSPRSEPSTASKKSKSSPAPLKMEEPPLWRRHLHWLLVMAMIPLAVSLLFHSSHETIGEKIGQTLEHSNVETQARFIAASDKLDSIDDLVNFFPAKKLYGAWLPRSTFAHFGMAFASALIYFVFFMFLASDGSTNSMHVLLVGLFTATIGVGLLLLIQWLAECTHGRLLMGKSIVVLVFYIFKLIAFSYEAADDPENGFFLSMIGFTLGVGLLEEIMKALPLFVHRHQEGNRKSWRSVFIWGLASGAGFGIAEGILYSSRYYNGIEGMGIYFTRFISCVALHAIWCGSTGITIYLNRHSFDGIDHWVEWIAPTLKVIAVPMVLHGAYDTCLKRDYDAVALLVAVASFGWLAFLSSRLYKTDDEAAMDDMLKEYNRRKKGMN